MVARISSSPHAPPGREWGYSNSAYYLAGLLVERVSGRSYWDFLRDSFFRPLGMRSAGPCAEAPPTARARGYRVEKGSLAGAEAENWRNPYAGGALCMTARDLLAWEAALDSGRALSAESVRAMRTPTRLANGRKYDYGLGTRLGSLDGHKLIGHTGGGQGFSTVLMRFPDDDLTIVVLKNFNGAPGAATIGARLARRLIGLPAFTPRRGAPPAAVLAAVAGDWVGDEGAFRLSSAEGRLRAEISGGPTVESAWMGGTTFVAGEEETGAVRGREGAERPCVAVRRGIVRVVIVRRKR
jgi:CubicO group peptidase (beta-lactamase class C family)